MAESLTVLTVPAKWRTPSSVNDSTVLQKIVGLVKPDGHELWTPAKPPPGTYMGSYGENYSPADVAEVDLVLGAFQTEKFISFFEKALIRRVGQRPEDAIYGYDCHWLAFWLMGQLEEDHTIDDSLELASAAIAAYAPEDRLPKPGEVGLLGGITCKDLPFPLHSLLAVDEIMGLQAMGKRGAVALAPQQASFQHYTEIGERIGYIEPDFHGVRILGSAAELQTAA